MQESILKDSIKESSARNHGYDYITVWENENLEQAKQKIVDLIKNKDTILYGINGIGNIN